MIYFIPYDPHMTDQRKKGWYSFMKKLLALALSLMMILASVSALAEENVVYFSEEAASAVEGEFVALEDFGLMFYLPAEMEAIELTEADIATGGYAGWKSATNAISIGYAPVTDDEGNVLTDLESLAAFYNASGMEAYIGTVNDLACVGFTVPGSTLSGLVFATESGNVLAFSFASLDTVTSVVASSIMVLE